MGFSLLFVLLLGANDLPKVKGPKTYQVYIAPECQVKNPSDRCLWTCLEMLGRHHRVKTLYGAANNPRWFPAYMHVDQVGVMLKRYKIRCRVHPRYTYDKTMLSECCKNKLGVAIGLKYKIKGIPCAHMIVVIHYDSKGAYFIDPNHPDKIYFADNAYLGNYWDGSAIAIYPNN